MIKLSTKTFARNNTRKRQEELLLLSSEKPFCGASLSVDGVQLQVKLQG